MPCWSRAHPTLSDDKINVWLQSIEIRFLIPKLSIGCSVKVMREKKKGEKFEPEAVDVPVWLDVISFGLLDERTTHLPIKNLLYQSSIGNKNCVSVNKTQNEKEKKIHFLGRGDRAYETIGRGCSWCTCGAGNLTRKKRQVGLGSL